MNRLFGLTLLATTGLAITTAAAAEPARVRGTVTAVSANLLRVHTATTGDVSILLRGDTIYLTESRSDVDHIPASSYIGVAAKNVGEKLVALDVLVFPPALKGAAEGHVGWDRIADTTSAGATDTSSSMTNGSVAAESVSASSVNSTMTNGSVTAATVKLGAKQFKLTYKDGEQTILVPPTAPIVNLQFGTVSDLKPGDIVFVNAIVDGSTTTAKLILVGSDGVAPPI